MTDKAEKTLPLPVVYKLSLPVLSLSHCACTLYCMSCLPRRFESGSHPINSVGFYFTKSTVKLGSRYIYITRRFCSASTYIHVGAGLQRYAQFNYDVQCSPGSLCHWSTCNLVTFVPRDTSDPHKHTCKDLLFTETATHTSLIKSSQQ